MTSQMAAEVADLMGRLHSAKVLLKKSVNVQRVSDVSYLQACLHQARAKLKKAFELKISMQRQIETPSQSKHEAGDVSSANIGSSNRKKDGIIPKENVEVTMDDKVRSSVSCHAERRHDDVALDEETAAEIDKEVRSFVDSLCEGWSDHSDSNDSTSAESDEGEVVEGKKVKSMTVDTSRADDPVDEGRMRAKNVVRSGSSSDSQDGVVANQPGVASAVPTLTTPSPRSNTDANTRRNSVVVDCQACRNIQLGLRQANHSIRHAVGCPRRKNRRATSSTDPNIPSCPACREKHFGLKPRKRHLDNCPSRVRQVRARNGR